PASPALRDGLTGALIKNIKPRLSDTVVQLTVDVPDDAQDLTGGFTYARLRLRNDPLTTSDPL
ncbi:MAG: hypothetical protein AAFR67_10900, partial [Chloroflexota bacterium]